MTVQEFDEVVATSKKLVLVDFYANWCGPCRLLLPVVDELHAKYADKLDVLKLDAEVEKELVAHFQVRSIPQVYLYKNNHQLEVGMIHKGNIEEVVAQNL